MKFVGPLSLCGVKTQQLPRELLVPVLVNKSGPESFFQLHVQLLYHSIHLQVEGSCRLDLDVESNGCYDIGQAIACHPSAEQSYVEHVCNWNDFCPSQVAVDYGEALWVWLVM